MDTLINGETANEYSLSGLVVSSYIRLEVTPVDSNGFAGEIVLSDPYYIEILD